MRVEEVASKLNMDRTKIEGLWKAGFFGDPRNPEISGEAFCSFKKYGAQWNTKLPSRLPPKEHPVVDGWENPPPDTKTEFCISLEKNNSVISDKYWAANFFFSTNDFYFPSRSALKRLDSLGISLKDKRTLKTDACEVEIFPDPNDRIALARIYGEIKDEDGLELSDYFIRAKTDLSPVLNWITLETDHPLPIMQENIVGLPSGNIHFMAFTEPREPELNGQNFYESYKMRHAISLYRTGLNCNQSLYALFSFIRAHEAIEEIRTDSDSRADIENRYPGGLRECSKLKIPNHRVFGNFREVKINKACQDIVSEYRNSIAHYVSYRLNPCKEEEKFLVGYSEEANQKIEASLATMRYGIRKMIDCLNKML